MELIYITKSEEATETLGEALGSRLFAGAVLLLDGELGAGKTVFARGVGKGLGVAAPIQSPTFTLMNAHLGRVPFYHFDLYRLNDEEELFDLGIEELLEGDGVTLVEWADRFADYFAEPALRVYISLEGQEERRIVLQAGSAAYMKVLRDLPAGGRQGADTGN